jgi:hypothetical protein
MVVMVLILKKDEKRSSRLSDMSLLVLRLLAQTGYAKGENWPGEVTGKAVEREAEKARCAGGAGLHGATPVTFGIAPSTVKWGGRERAG